MHLYAKHLIYRQGSFDKIWDLCALPPIFILLTNIGTSCSRSNFPHLCQRSTRVKGKPLRFVWIFVLVKRWDLGVPFFGGARALFVVNQRFSEGGLQERVRPGCPLQQPNEEKFARTSTHSYSSQTHVHTNRSDLVSPDKTVFPSLWQRQLRPTDDKGRNLLLSRMSVTRTTSDAILIEDRSLPWT